MNLQTRFYRIALFKAKLVICLIFTTIFSAFSQIDLTLTVEDGMSTTTCTGFWPSGTWQVNIENEGWVTYPESFGGFCYNNPPNIQYSNSFTCPDEIPTMINVCFKAYYEAGLPCNFPPEECVETICQDFVIPAPGVSELLTLEIPDGLSSDGFVDFTLSLSATLAATNDDVCDAYDFGQLTLGQSVGDLLMGTFSNICADSLNEPIPTNASGWDNNQGVWFQFTTPDDPDFITFIQASSDPENTGDIINLQLALYETTNGTCDGGFVAIENAYDSSTNDESMQVDCLEPNTNYYFLVDGSITQSIIEGVFGLEITTYDVITSANFVCDALDMGPVPDGATITSGPDQSNTCSDAIGDPNITAFDSQYSVWFQFQAPSSGNVSITAITDTDVDPVDAQLALFGSSDNTCNGNFTDYASAWTGPDFDETITAQCLEAGANYWVLLDGSGNDFFGLFEIQVTDTGFEEMFTIEETICYNDTIFYGDAAYFTEGPIQDSVRLDDGCYSIVTGFLTVLDQNIREQDFTICGGDSIVVGTSVYYDTGNFQDVFTDYQGCDSTVITNMIVYDEVNVNAMQVTMASSEFDMDGEATADVVVAAPPVTYEWSNGATTQTISNVMWGQYCVTITDANNCTDESCTTVTYPGYVAVLVDDFTLDCFGDTDGELNFSIEGGEPGYTYEWGIDYGPAIGSGTIDNEGDMVSLTDLSPGTYTISVTESEGFFLVQEVDVIEPEAIVTTIDTVLCFGESIVVNGQIYDADGPINELATSFAGCDSTIVGFVDIRDDIVTTLDETICAGETYMVNGQAYATTGPINEIGTSFTGCDSTISGMLTVLPLSFYTLDTTICFGETITVAGGTYTDSGMYSDTLTAFNNCDSIITTTLTILDEMTIDILTIVEATDLGIADGSLEASVTGGTGNYTHEWSTGETNVQAIGLIGGDTYCVTVTDDLNCSIEDCQFMAYPLPIFTNIIGDVLDCNGDNDGSFSLTATNGIPPYNYSFTNDDGSISDSGILENEGDSFMVNDLPAGNYTIYLENGFVDTTVVAVVEEPDLLEASVVSLTDVSCFSFCDGNVIIDILGGVAPYQVDGITTGAQFEIANNCANEYMLNVVDANGCQTLVDFIITEPVEFIAEATEVAPVSCFGGADGIASVSTNGNPVAYSWDNGDTDIAPVNLNEGEHFVTITNVDNCQDIVSVVINAPDAPLAVELVQSQDVSCNGFADASVDALSPTGGTGTNFNYAWTNGDIDSTLEAVPAGSYEVTVTDEANCTTVADILVEEPDPIYYEISTEDINCFNQVDFGSVFVDTVGGGVGPYVYSVDGENFNSFPVISDLAAGPHAVYVEDASGCVEEEAFFINSPDPIIISLEAYENIKLGDSIRLSAIPNSANAVFEWTPADGLSCVDCYNPYAQPFRTTEYTITVLDTLTGCSETAVTTVQVINEKNIYVPNVFSPNNDGNNDFIIVRSDNSVDIIRRFVIYDRWGTILLDRKNFDPNDDRNSWSGFFNGRVLNPGVYVYLLEVDFKDGEAERKTGSITLLR